MSEKKVRWGILSTANIAVKALIPAIRESQTGVVHAIASRDAAKAKQKADELGIPNAYGDYMELLQDPEIDAVYIPLPNHLHREWTIKAARAKKHVLCEKPLTVSERHAVQMVEACEQYGVLLSEAFMYRYHPRYDRIREIIASGEIGKVRAISGAFTFNNEGDAANVRYRKEWGGGSVYDVGVYPISAARYLLGQEPLAASVVAQFSPNHDNVDMMASGLLEFPDNVVLTFDCGMWTYYRNKLEIVGSLGTIEVPNAFLPPKGGAGIIVHTQEGRREEAIPDVNAYTLQVDAFGRSILEGAPLRFRPEDSIAMAKAVDACLRSAEENTRVKLA